MRPDCVESDFAGVALPDLRTNKRISQQSNTVKPGSLLILKGVHLIGDSIAN